MEIKLDGFSDTFTPSPTPLALRGKILEKTGSLSTESIHEILNKVDLFEFRARKDGKKQKYTAKVVVGTGDFILVKHPGNKDFTPEEGQFTPQTVRKAFHVEVASYIEKKNADGTGYKYVVPILDKYNLRDKGPEACCLLSGFAAGAIQGNSFVGLDYNVAIGYYLGTVRKADHLTITEIINDRFRGCKVTFDKNKVLSAASEVKQNTKGKVVSLDEINEVFKSLPHRLH